MKTWNGAGALVFGALILGGCAASRVQGAQVRVHTTTAAFERYAPSREAVMHRPKRSSHKESATARACKAGSSKACIEVGDRLSLKYAHGEARQWYATACERVRSSMLPTATRLVQLSRELKQRENAHSEQEEENIVNQRRLSELKSDASEMRARLQGCVDAGYTLNLDKEPKQALEYYDAVCEFSTLAGAVGEALQGFQQLTERGCEGGQSARDALGMTMPFSPRLFADLAPGKQKTTAAAKPSAAPAEEGGMVFNEGDL